MAKITIRKNNMSKILIAVLVGFGLLLLVIYYFRYESWAANCRKLQYPEKYIEFVKSFIAEGYSKSDHIYNKFGNFPKSAIKQIVLDRQLYDSFSKSNYVHFSQIENDLIINAGLAKVDDCGVLELWFPLKK